MSSCDPLPASRDEPIPQGQSLRIVRARMADEDPRHGSGLRSVGRSIAEHRSQAVLLMSLVGGHQTAAGEPRRLAHCHQREGSRCPPQVEVALREGSHCPPEVGVHRRDIAVALREGSGCPPQVGVALRKGSHCPPEVGAHRRDGAVALREGSGCLSKWESYFERAVVALPKWTGYGGT